MYVTTLGNGIMESMAHLEKVILESKSIAYLSGFIVTNPES